MTRVNNLNTPVLPDVIRRVRAVEAAPLIGSSSITRPGSGLRVQSDRGIVAKQVPGGAPAISVEGRQSVSGLLDGDGTLDWEGPWWLRGDGEVIGRLLVRGLWELIGNGEITGDVDISGILRLLSDLIVEGGGRIRVGTALTLDPSENGGSILFGASGDGLIYGDGDGIIARSSAGGATLLLRDNHAILTGPGGTSIILDGDGIRFIGVPRVPKAGIPSDVLYLAADGTMRFG